MPTTSAELAGASPAEIAEARSALSNFLATSFPSFSLQAGPLSDLILAPSADALAAVDTRATTAANSLNPYVALAQGNYDPTILNQALAGLGVTRIAAAKASGTAAIRFSVSTTISVPSGYQLPTVDGVAFATVGSNRLLAPGSTPVAPNDQVMITDPAGGYVGVVPVTAVAVGVAGNRPAGTVLTASNLLPNQNLAYLATNTIGGADAESDSALLVRLPAATAPRTSASFVGAMAVAQAAYAYSNVQVVGYGDPGMLRGRSVLTGQTPGRIDVRVRVNSSPGRTRVPVVATYVGLVAGQTQWQFTLGAAADPGWFSVERIVKSNAQLTTSGYLPTSLVSGYDTSVMQNPPAIQTPLDAFFSRFATAVVQFVDPDTSPSGLVVNVSTKSYDCVCRDIPGVVATQTALSSPTTEAAGGDALARGAAPVMTSVSVTATIQVGVSLTSAQLAEAVAQAINNTTIGLTLASSVVGAGAQAFLPTGTSLQFSGWSGVVSNLDGSQTTITGVDGLVLSTNVAEGLNANTVAYYADETSITATVVTL